jgi:hypothetical protein
MPKQSYSHNCLLNHQNFAYLSKHDNSTHSLPILLDEHTSFAQFIAEEKYGLQFFPSFRKTIANEKNKKKLIENFDFLSYDVRNNYYSLMNCLKAYNDFDDGKTAVCASHSSKFSLSASSSKSSTKKTKSVSTNLARVVIGIININRKRRMRCIERHISYMNNAQTKAALCFIRQLNSYINQKNLPSQKEYSESNENYVQSKKV